VRPVEKPAEEKIEPAEHYLLAVRLDGLPNVKPGEELTLNALRIKKRFNAVLLPDTASFRGMLQRVKDHVTWSEAKKEDVELLLSDRASTEEGLGITDRYVKEKTKLGGVGELVSALYSGKLRLPELRQMGVKPVFRLHPPRGGFRRSSKRPFADRGELGYRKDGLYSLLTRMR
jgi:large subunit ribosomal protein L30